jgi:tRNA(adenine34) deaminase
MEELLKDEYFMLQALKEAETASDEGEVPVGAIIVLDNLIIARAFNQVELLQDPTAHAELLAITAACSHLGSKFLDQCTMYVTLEPCVMCAGALRWTRIGRLVYGASDDKHGFMQFGKELLHPKTKLAYGVMMEKCSDHMKSFFKVRRD